MTCQNPSGTCQFRTARVYPVSGAVSFPLPRKKTLYMSDSMRLDKWLWAARFFKTRSLASQEVVKGRVQVNQQMVKPARDIKPGDTIWVKRGDSTMTVVVRTLSAVRGPAPVAQQLYEETAASIAAREQAAEMRRLAPEPSRDFEQGRPTKRDRRLIDRLKDGDY